jgi:carboxymethylenebutenolidase
MGEMITFAGNGDQYEGYLKRAASGRGPGVIVIQEWWGLVGHIKSVVDRFAAEGFTALAPDLYKGERTEDPDEAGKLMMALNIAETEKILRFAVDRLIEDYATEGDKVGVVGFCMGGQLALYAAATNPKIGACVDFYGIHPNVQPPFHQLQSPVLGIFAEQDAYASAERVAELDKQLNEHAATYEFHTYPGTKHAFFNDDRPEVYNKEAAEDAWRRMIEFFRQNLRQA